MNSKVIVNSRFGLSALLGLMTVLGLSSYGQSGVAAPTLSTDGQSNATYALSLECLMGRVSHAPNTIDFVGNFLRSFGDTLDKEKIEGRSTTAGRPSLVTQSAYLLKVMFLYYEGSDFISREKKLNAYRERFSIPSSISQEPSAVNDPEVYKQLVGSHFSELSEDLLADLRAEIKRLKSVIAESQQDMKENPKAQCLSDRSRLYLEKIEAHLL